MAKKNTKSKKFFKKADKKMKSTANKSVKKISKPNNNSKEITQLRKLVKELNALVDTKSNLAISAAKTASVAVENIGLKLNELKRQIFAPLEGRQISAPLEGFTLSNDNLTIQQTNNNTPSITYTKPPTGKTTKIQNTDFSGGLAHIKTVYSDLYGIYHNELGVATDTIADLSANIKYLKKTELTGLDYKYVDIKKQNELLDEQIKKTKESYSTDNQKTFFKQDKSNTLKTINFILFLSYYICLLGLAYMLIINNTIDLYVKMGIMFVLLLYPYFIRIIEKGLVFIYDYITAILGGNVYISRNL